MKINKYQIELNKVCITFFLNEIEFCSFTLLIAIQQSGST